MACSVSVGRNRFCCSQVGGIKKVYFATFDGDDSLSNPSQKITSVTVSDAGVVTDIHTPDNDGDVYFFQFELDRQLSSFNQTIVTGSGGSVAYQQDLELHMVGDSEQSWAKMQQLVESLMYAIVLDNNGVYYLCGVENGIECSGGTYAHGGDVAYTDYVGYVLNFSGTELKPAYNLSTTSPFKGWTSSQLEIGAINYQECQA
tara:strand:- start:610 stop:1215 length:606 start_codon:yes stop_codon:yes gene_type:complete